jgi:hypothetical protein
VAPTHLSVPPTLEADSASATQRVGTAVVLQCTAVLAFVNQNSGLAVHEELGTYLAAGGDGLMLLEPYVISFWR